LYLVEHRRYLNPIMLYLEPKERFVRKVFQKIVKELDPKYLVEKEENNQKCNKTENVLEFVSSWIGELGNSEDSIYYKIRGILGGR